MYSYIHNGIVLIEFIIVMKIINLIGLYDKYDCLGKVIKGKTTVLKNSVCIGNSNIQYNIT